MPEEGSRFLDDRGGGSAAGTKSGKSGGSVLSGASDSEPASHFTADGAASLSSDLALDRRRSSKPRLSSASTNSDEKASDNAHGHTGKEAATHKKAAAHGKKGKKAHGKKKKKKEEEEGADDEDEDEAEEVEALGYDFLGGGGNGEEVSEDGEVLLEAIASEAIPEQPLVHVRSEGKTSPCGKGEKKKRGASGNQALAGLEEEPAPFAHFTKEDIQKASFAKRVLHAKPKARGGDYLDDDGVAISQEEMDGVFSRRRRMAAVESTLPHLARGFTYDSDSEADAVSNHDDDEEGGRNGE